MVKHVPDTGQIVLTPVDGGGGGCSAHCTGEIYSEANCSTSTPSPTTSSHDSSEIW